MISIEKLSSANASAYEAFLRGSGGAMFYHSLKHIEFLKAFTNSEQETVLAIEGEKVVGCLPMLAKNGKYGKVLNSLPFYGSHGAILSDSIQGKEALEGYLHKIKDQFLSSVFIMNPFHADESANYGVKVDERIGQITYLPSDVDQLISIFHFKTRNMVRKGEKSGADVKISNTDFDFLYETHAENMSKIGGKPKPREFFHLIPKFFEAEKDFNIFTAELNGTKIAALLVFYFKDTVEYYTPVIVNEYRDSQVLSFIIYRVMLDAISKGFKVWNWGGTWKTQEGVYRFKSRWGAQDKHYNYYMSYQNELFKHPLKDLTPEYPWFYIGPYSMWEKSHV